VAKTGSSVALIAAALIGLLSARSAFAQAKFWQGPDAQNSPSLSLITNLAQLRSLDETAAAAGIPVRIQAVVTYCENQWPTLFVQDGDNPAYVFRPKGTIPLVPGDRVDIEGKSGNGFSPLIDATAIWKIGTAELPRPVNTTLEELGTGRYDGLRVRVLTTVRWMHITFQRLYLHIGEGSGRYEVHIPEHLGSLPTNLLGATVELIGVTGTKLDTHGYVVGAGLSIPRVEDVRVITPTPEHPWERSTQTISSLMRYHGSTSFGQRTKVAGVVTLNTPSGKLYVEDASGGCEIRLPYYDRPDGWGKYLDPPRPADLKVGDQVEVLGYQNVGSYGPIIADAVVRRVGPTNLPPPQVTTGTNVLMKRIDSKRVRLEGRVVANEQSSTRSGIRQRLTINSEADNSVFFAEFEGAAPLDAPVESRVAVAGVCSLDTDEARRITGFRVLVPHSADLEILSLPPPISTQAILRIGGAIAVVILGWVWVLRVQVRRRTSALAESEARLRTITDHNPAGIVVLDADEGRFIEANETAERMTGYSRDELLRRGPVETSAPTQANGRSTSEMAREVIDHILKEGQATFDWISRNADGFEYPIETRAARIPIPGRNLIVASMVDIRARKEAEAELTRALAREKELSELKSSFVSMVSHEFRTPLEIIISSADNLQRYHDRLPAEKRQQLLQSINRAVMRMSGMMEEVLVLGRLETDRITFNPDRIDLAAFCQRLSDEIESATNRRCPVQLQLKGSLDNATGDEGLLRHIFTNLLSNAVKYSTPGQPVDFSIARESDNAICRITDHGCGIPEADQKHLFQAFHRGSNVRQVPGTGLGLLIVRRCIELHGGEIIFESAESRGTTFTVRLPLFGKTEAPRRDFIITT
jgi:PAS domain S-box-containing protein